MIFDRNDKLDSLASSDGFFNSGVMMAVFWDAGRKRSRSDVLTIAVMYGRRTSTYSFSKSVGMGSIVHDFV